MIKGRIIKIDRQPDQVHHVSDQFGVHRQITGRKGSTVITFVVDEIDSEARGIDMTNTKFIMVPEPVNAKVEAEEGRPEVKPTQKKETTRPKKSKEFGSW